MQHKGVHARLARAADGTKMIELLKRNAYSDNVKTFIHKAAHNTNGESIKLNIPVEEKDTTDDSAVATAVSVVYVTLDATFSGSVVGYVTVGATDTSSSTSVATAITTASSTTSAAQVLTSSSSTSNAAGSSSSTVTYAATVGTAQAQSRSTSASTATAVSDASTDSLTTSQQSTSSGMTDGAKAGLAIGVILAIALAAGLFFFCWKRAKKDNSHEELNEKRSSFFGAGAQARKRASADSDKSFGTLHATATAPRLSLRPVTQFLPTFGEKRKSGNLLGFAPQMSEKSTAWDRQPQGENPFSDSSEKNPFDEGDSRSVHSNGSKQSSDSVESGTSASAGAAAVAASDASPARGPNNVHRVQLDFKPSMDDELELKSGQLVRMLHEYDDGWALCVRMDRSQQGVAPRTCLSKTPVKPRGPPPGGRISPNQQMRGPQSRPMTPNGQQSAPNVARKPVPGQAI